MTMTKFTSPTTEKAWQKRLAERKKAAEKYDNEHRQWLYTKFSEFEFSADARFESMLQYPKRRSLYRKHVDIGRDYERKSKFYTNWQRLTDKESARREQSVQDRFTKLLYQTVTSSVCISDSLRFSYHSWLIKTGTPEHLDTLSEHEAPTLKLDRSNEGDGWDQTLSPVRSCANDVRDSANLVSSQRSMSVDNLARVVGDTPFRQPAVLSRLMKSLSSLSVDELGST